MSWKPSTEIPPPGGIIRLAITGPTFKRGEYFALPIGGGRAAAFRVTWASRDGSALTARRVDGMPSDPSE